MSLHRLRLESQTSSDPMSRTTRRLLRRARRSIARDLLRIQSQPERHFDAGTEGLGVAESEDTGVVDAGFDEGGVVEVGSGTDFERDGLGGGFGVVDPVVVQSKKI